MTTTATAARAPARTAAGAKIKRIEAIGGDIANTLDGLDRAKSRFVK